MKLSYVGLLAAGLLTGLSAHDAKSQEILLGYLPAGAGPFATLSRTNEIAAQMAKLTAH